MYKTRKQLKKAALKALSGKWGLATPMALIIFFVSVSLSYNGNSAFGVTILPICSTLLTVILNVGFYSFMLKLLCGQKDHANFQDLFYGFKCHPGKALLLYLLTMLYMLPDLYYRHLHFYLCDIRQRRSQHGSDDDRHSTDKYHSAACRSSYGHCYDITVPGIYFIH